MAKTAGSSGFKTFPAHKRSGSMYETNSKFGGSMYATPFILDQDKSNKHRVVNDVEKTMTMTTEIPFLRTQIDPKNFSKTQHGTFMGSYINDRSYSAQKGQ